MGRRHKIVHVITRMVVGGAQENTLLSCARVDPDRYESVLVTGPDTGPEGDLLDEARDAGVRVVVEPTLRRAVRPLDDVAAIRALRRTLRSEAPAIVHTHSSKAGILGRIAARGLATHGVVHTVHGWSFHNEMPAATRAAYVAAERLCARMTDFLIVVTVLDRDKGLVAKVGRPDHYRLIRSGFDLEPFASAQGARDEVRLELGIEPSAPVIGSVMRLSDQKDPLTWIAVASEVARRHPSAHFILVGDGPLKSDVVAAARQGGIEGRLHLLGVRRDVPRLLSALDVFLLTSRWEGLPKVVVQSMAAGVPVVATATDGVREVVQDARTGLLGPVGGTDDLSGAVVRLLENDVLRRALVSAGRDVAPEFAASTMIAELTALYDELTTSR